MKKQGLFWHVHHDQLLENCFDYKERIDYVRREKPKNEIKTRFRLFKPVKGQLPKELIEARQRYAEARQKWLISSQSSEKDAWIAYIKADNELRKAIAKYSEEIKALHEKECPDCSWNGKEIVFKEAK